MKAEGAQLSLWPSPPTTLPMRAVPTPLRAPSRCFSVHAIHTVYLKRAVVWGRPLCKALADALEPECDHCAHILGSKLASTLGCN